ncbi:hypothetical protein Tco_0362380, partial [Tanacetum coccineum]
SDGKGIGSSGQIDILAVCCLGDGTGVGAPSSVSNASVSPPEGIGSTIGIARELVGARCSSSSLSSSSSSKGSLSSSSISSSSSSSRRAHHHHPLRQRDNQHDPP